MTTGDIFLKNKLQERAVIGTLRSLSKSTYPIDFCSNDYLGFARSATLHQNIKAELSNLPRYKNGSGGSRLLAGNLPYTEELEAYIAHFHNAPAGLIFNSGYDANIGLLSCVPQKGDTIITDEMIHASLIDGARLSNATRYKFKHNDIADLEQKIKNAKGNIYIVIESVYSMDGDIAPLRQISDLCTRYNANLLVDEAHATGIFGSKGAGLVQELNLEDHVFARTITFGKALGCHGAIVLGSNLLREYLINFARSFIYTTAAPIHFLSAIRQAYRMLEKTNMEEIHNRIETFNTSITGIFSSYPAHQSPIKTIFLNSNEKAKVAAQQLQANGYDVRAILSPTVPAGTERLRICLHTYNTDIEIAELITVLRNFNYNE